jgi:hypothetical protein
MKNIFTNLKETPKNVLIFISIILIISFFYWGFQDNYFFSDDFEWLSRGILAQESTSEIFKIVGRDFNPVFLGLLTITIRAVGLSPLVPRLLSLLVFSGVIFMFFYLLSRYFKVHPVIAFPAALLAGLNVFISEVVVNLAALVYSLSLLFFLTAVKFYFDGKRKRFLFLLFVSLAMLTKETVLLGVIPLFFLDKDKKNRLFLFVSVGVLVLIRVLLQTGAAGSYTSFMHFSNFFYKLYFIILRTMNISPYAMNPAVGVGIVVILLLIGVYFIVRCWKAVDSQPYPGETASGHRGRMFLFFLLWLVVFSLFFSMLPKLSSRYLFYPVFGFWGFAALVTHYFHQNNKNKKIRYALVPLLLVSMLFNYPLIRGEVGDYKILGDFSRQFIRRQGEVIKAMGTGEIMIYKLDYRQLAGIYKTIKDRGNLPKLLPFRSHSVGGVIKPEHLVPLIFYPEKIVRWHLVKETPNYFTGHLLNN